MPAGNDFLHVFVDEGEARACVAQDPGGSKLWWGKKLVGLRVVLRTADATEVRELLGGRLAAKSLEAPYLRCLSK